MELLTILTVKNTMTQKKKKKFKVILIIMIRIITTLQNIHEDLSKVF